MQAAQPYMTHPSLRAAELGMHNPAVAGDIVTSGCDCG